MFDFKNATTDQLKSLIADATAEIEARTSCIVPVRVAIARNAYNERRYGKPWIAAVTSWPVGGTPTLQFGRYTGRDGDAGEAEILAMPGSLIKYGQKDHRNDKGSTSQFAQVLEDGSIRDLTNAEARELCR